MEGCEYDAMAHRGLRMGLWVSGMVPWVVEVDPKG